MPAPWYIGEALIALARNRRDGAKPFTRADLRAWSPAIKARPPSARHALDALMRCDFVRRGAPHGTHVEQGQWTYTMTPAGRGAAAAAELTRFREDQAAAAAEKTRTRKEQAAAELIAPGSYASRVYALLRMRKVITPQEAAATLIDAGQDVRAYTREASRYLKAWSQQFPHAVQVSSFQRANRAHPYVLVADLGPSTPPVTSTKKTARGGAAA